jgi:hypothetical protein
MRKLLPVAGAFLTILAATRVQPAQGQEAGAFADVPTSSWTYRAAAELQRQSVVTGWPADYFSGKRTLTRYEFVIALKRALDKLEYSGPAVGDDNVAAVASSELHITPQLLAQVRELVEYFKIDLVNLHTNLDQVNERLTQLTRRISSGRTSPMPMPQSLMPRRANGNVLDGYVGQNPGIDFLHGNGGGGLAPFSGGGAAPLSALVAGHRDSILEPLGSGLIGKPDGTLGGNNTEFRLALPLTSRSMLGVSLRDALVTDNLLSPSPYRSLGLGAGLSLQPVGHLTVGAEANRNITTRLSQDGSLGSVLDTNSYLLDVGYQSGQASATLGYRFIDPTVTPAATWSGNLLGLSPITNIQGPFTRIAFRFSDRLQSYFGGDYYANTGFRAAVADSTPGAGIPTLLTGNIYRGTAGIRWSPTRRISFTADYEGVLYDISGSASSSGRRFQPIEQYITLGAGVNLSRNAILKLAYQIYNQQDGSGSSDSPFSNNNGNTSVFTTQLAVHF